jgi:hypothetical protein
MEKVESPIASISVGRPLKRPGATRSKKETTSSNGCGQEKLESVIIYKNKIIDTT